MGNNDILIPGKVQDREEFTPTITPEEYLKIVNALSEIKEQGAQSIARSNLGVYGTTDVDDMINQTLHEFLDKLDNLKQIINSYASDNKESYDQLTSQLGEYSTKEENNALKQELLNKLTNTLKSYLTAKEVDERIVESLVDYVTSSQVYKKEDVYTKKETDKALSNYVKTDGSTPFTSTQQGVYPKVRKDLATKGYSDDCMKNHKNEADPHGYTAILNNKLNNYYKKSEVYTKAQTYDRTTIDALVDKLVKEACDSLIEEHINVTPHLTSQDVLRVVKNYASDNLLNEEEFERSKEEILEAVESLIKETRITWKTSGPVETTVGFVEDNSEVPAEMTLQEIMDAIFYGKGISLTVPDSVSMGDSCEVTVCIHGSLALVESAILYQDGEILKEFTQDDFVDGCITVESNPIYDDTEFTFRVIYTNGTELEETKTVTCSLPIFIGALPKWKFANTINWEYLEELKREKLGTFTQDTSYDFSFEDVKLRHPFIVVPVNYPELESVVIKSQSFGIEAFDIIDVIPLRIPGTDKDTLYKIYVYRQALSSLNQKVTFNFKSE